MFFRLERIHGKSDEVMNWRGVLLRVLRRGTLADCAWISDLEVLSPICGKHCAKGSD
jgi:hypothetical protein